MTLKSCNVTRRLALWLVPAFSIVSIVLLAAQPLALAEPPEPSPSDAPLPPPEEPTVEEPAVAEPAPPQAAAEEAVAEPEGCGSATCRPKAACAATCRPKPLARLRARLRCCLSRPLCRPRCCEPAYPAEPVPVCAPADSAQASQPAPVQFASEQKPVEEAEEAEKPEEPAEPKCPKKKNPYAFKAIFDGKTLEGWKVPNFGGQGDVKVKDGKIILEMGADMTGITYQGDVPQTNYEIEFEAQRLKGNDFFATTTFRVGKDPLTFVVGGWGGTVVGLSNVDFYDASDNMTTNFQEFKDQTWYTIRVRVTDAKVECWIDDKRMVNQHRKDHKFGIRWECELCKPLGISTWCTGAAVKNIRMRKLSPKEVEAAAKEAKEEEAQPSFG